MTSTPMILEDALRFSGYTIDAYEAPGRTINTVNGPIVIPTMILSRLVWQRENAPELGAAFYLDKLPPFHPDYAPVQLSLILDRFRSRRLAYETVDEFSLAVRRWGALNLGAMSTLTRRYLSTATPLPLDTVDLLTRTDSAGSGVDTGSTTANTTGTGTDSVRSTDNTNTTTKARDAQSEFPQGALAGSGDYASGATDSAGTGTVVGTGTTTAEREQTGTSTSSDNRTTSDTREETRAETGRSQTIMALLAEQRATFLNVDAELLGAMESLFLGVFDRSTADDPMPRPYGRGWGW